MDRIAKLKIGCIFFVLAVMIGAALFLGVVEYSRQQLLAENLEKGKNMLAEQDYQSARIYLSLFEEKGNAEVGFNLYSYAAAMIAYQTYLGTGDINQIQVASDYLNLIDMSKLNGYTGRVQELKGKVEGDLNAYHELVEAQEQAESAAKEAQEAAKTQSQREVTAENSRGKETTKQAEPAVKTAVPATQAAEPAPTPATEPLPVVPSKTAAPEKK